MQDLQINRVFHRDVLWDVLPVVLIMVDMENESTSEEEDQDSNRRCSVTSGLNRGGGWLWLKS